MLGGVPPPTGNKIEIMPHQTKIFFADFNHFYCSFNALFEGKTNRIITNRITNQDKFAVVSMLIFAIANKYLILVKVTYS